MHTSQTLAGFKSTALGQTINLLPVKVGRGKHPVTCRRCGYVNDYVNNFCTDCGYPVKAHDSDSLASYHLRLVKKAQVLKQCRTIITQATGTLYIMALICFIAAAFAFTDEATNRLRGYVFLIISTIYFALARYTLTKPFTALLISFLMLVSFIAINTWAAFSVMFTGSGLYLLGLQIVLFFYIFRAVKAAYQADILEEEHYDGKQ